MNYSSNKLLYIRRAVFVVLIMLTALAQNTKGGFIKIGAASAMLPLALTVCVAMSEKSVPALLFSAFSGAFLDMFSAKTDGFFTIAFAVIGFACSILITFRMQNNIKTALILTLAASLLLNTVYWLLFYVLKSYDMLLHIYLKYYLSSAVLTTALAGVYYYIVKWVCDLTKPERKRINY